jgi:hypothetical protein
MATPSVGGAASLDGAFAKLRRAKEHLQLFEEEASRVLVDIPRPLVTDVTYDPDVPRFLVRPRDDARVPSRLSTIAGDVIQNLRSSLDHLAYQLPILATGSPWEHTQWPIVATFDEIEEQWRFKGLRKRLIDAGRWDLWAMVEFYQAVWYVQEFPPPEGVDIFTQRYRDVPLLVLNELSNQDKHRLLLEPAVSVGHYLTIVPRCIRDCENPRPIMNTLWYGLKKKTVILHFTADITGPEPEMEVYIDFIPRPISFVGLQEPAVDYFVLMTDAVRAVLDDFAPFF